MVIRGIEQEIRKLEDLERRLASEETAIEETRRTYSSLLAEELQDYVKSISDAVRHYSTLVKKTEEVRNLGIPIDPAIDKLIEDGKHLLAYADLPTYKEEQKVSEDTEKKEVKTKIERIKDVEGYIIPAVELLHDNGEGKKVINARDIEELLDVQHRGDKVKIGIYLAELNKKGYFLSSKRKLGYPVAYEIDPSKFETKEETKTPEIVTEEKETSVEYKRLSHKDLTERIRSSPLIKRQMFSSEEIKREIGYYEKDEFSKIFNEMGYKLAGTNGGPDVYEKQARKIEQGNARESLREIKREISEAFRQWNGGPDKRQRELLAKHSLEFISNGNHPKIIRRDMPNVSVSVAKTPGDKSRGGKNTAIDIFNHLISPYYQ